MSFLRGKLTYANVMATVAVFIALGGSAYAATQLKKNSVGTKQLKRNSVTAVKIKKGTITGKQIDLAKLGTVPSASHASSADTIPAAEPIHLVGAPGEPGFAAGTANVGEVIPGFGYPPVGFYKDQFGVVHLEGVAKISGGGPGTIFVLPAGYRPAPHQSQVFSSGTGSVQILGSDDGPVSAGAILATNEIVSLSGITYRGQG